MAEENEQAAAVRERVRRVIKEVVGRSPGSDDESLRDLGVDSFMIIELTMALEAEFSITIPDESLQWCTMDNVGQIDKIVVGGLEQSEGSRP
jgi:acyl carrier protein